MSEAQQTTWATIGHVVALFGVRGELKVRSLTDIPDRFQKLKVVHLGPDYREYGIEHVRPYKGEMVLLKLAGIDDANAAEALRNQDLFIPLGQLAELPPDNYYQHDIIGLTVTLLDGRELGCIVDILETGSNDVYIIQGPDGKQVLIPATKEVVKSIDLTQHKMSVDPLPGLLEPGSQNEEEENREGAGGEQRLNKDFSGKRGAKNRE